MDRGAAPASAYWTVLRCGRGAARRHLGAAGAATPTCAPSKPHCVRMAAMLRIRLDIDDLARVRLAPTGVAATIEAVFSSIAVRRADAPLLYGDWGRDLLPRLGPDAAPLFDLFRSPWQVPRFMIKRT